MIFPWYVPEHMVANMAAPYARALSLSFFVQVSTSGFIVTVVRPKVPP